MRYLVTGRQMKEIDQNTMNEIGIPSMVLMERAALEVTGEILKRSSCNDKILIACGHGNNGADGIAVARMLFLKNYDVTVVLAQANPNGTAEWNQQFEIINKLGVPVLSFEDMTENSWDILVDAVFGVGLGRPIEGKYYEFIKTLIGYQSKLTVAVDIPSGIHADCGQVMGIGIKADLTVTFGYQKIGTMLYPGKNYSGEMIVADIGFPSQAFKEKEESAYTYEKSDLERIPGRPSYSNKGSFGRVLIVAGSKNMSGAAFLSGMASYRMGTGLVKILTVAENRQILQQQLPEAIMEVYEPLWIGQHQAEFDKWIESQCKWAGFMIIGPGLGQQDYVDTLMEALLRHRKVPAVIDADGLNCLARNRSLGVMLGTDVIITPHLGEMARLCDRSVAEIQEKMIETIRAYSDETGVTCILKDTVTVVTKKKRPLYLNSSGNSGMAKAGSGDVLTGVIAGLLALGMEPYEAAVLAVYLHGMAGDIAKEKKGIHGMMARDLADQLGTFIV